MVPFATTRSKAASSVSISRSRPYSFSGISSRSDMSCAPSGNGSMRPVCLPFRQAAPEIGLDARGGLVALLGSLGEKLHHNRRERPRDARDPLVGRHRLPRDVAVHPLHRIGGGEGQLARQHLVEGDAQGIEIAAGIDRPVHPAGLFRRHVGERPGDHLRRRGGLVLARQTRGDAEARQPHAAGCRVHQDICRLDVLVDEASLMHLAERPRERDRDAQELRYSSGRPSSRSSGSPPGSSSTSVMRPL